MLIWGLRSPKLLELFHRMRTLCLDLSTYFFMFSYTFRVPPPHLGVHMLFEWPQSKKKIHSYNYIKQKILFYQDRFIDRMIQVTVYLQLNLFMIFSAHITLFFRTVVNIFIDDQFLDRNLCIPPFYTETIRKRTFLYDLWDF